MSDGWLTLVILIFSHGLFFLAGAATLAFVAWKYGQGHKQS